MSNSPLVNYTKISPNKSSPRNHKIDTVTIHCVVGQCSVETLGNVFAPASRQRPATMVLGMTAVSVCMSRRKTLVVLLERGERQSRNHD